ncbi:MAG: DegT/DnrJ/EryC1/StrS family aminotransferase [Armatimonadota bacterium]|nr:DegT/DnrJ/EryC1/StrS family aminotransferase [Armatimonadota bacterium]
MLSQRSDTETRTTKSYPLIRPTLPDPDEILDQVRTAMQSGRVTCGSNVEALEKEVSNLIGVKHVIAVSSATSGLVLLFRALGLQEDSEIITPSFTFAATAHALLWNRLKPVFCDCEPGSFTMDASLIEAAITPRTRAVYPVCVFGVPGDLEAYASVAEKHGLLLVYDSAQGLGSKYKGQWLGGFGAAEVFSMSPTKVVTALEGGLVTTNDDTLAERIRSMRDYGKGPDGQDMVHLGLSARMSEINAIVARWSLARVEQWIAARETLITRYQQRLADLPGVRFQSIPEWCRSSRNYCVILIDPDKAPVTRDELHDALAESGIQTKRYFYPPLHHQTLYRDMGLAADVELPVTERISALSLAVPLYSHMSVDDVDWICDRIISIFSHATRS